MGSGKLRRLGGLVALLGALALAQDFPVWAQQSSAIGTNAPCPALSDVVILLIRHAEKPETGFGLTPAGEARAAAYVKYFQNLSLDSRKFTPDYLFAAADSTNSHRSRLTIEPLSKALGLKIENQVKNKDFASLVQEIRARDHGKNILIAWHHGEIVELAKALGADGDKLVPGGKWPDNVFDWMLELRYDHEGRLIPGETKRINEKLMPGDSTQ